MLENKPAREVAAAAAVEDEPQARSRLQLILVASAGANECGEVGIEPLCLL